jgi:uncharacterized membrane protein
MGTTQIVILSVLFVVFMLGFIYTNTVAKEKNQTHGGILVMFLAFTMAMITLVIGLLQYNQLQLQAKGKCPEFEKLENVYRIK